VTAIETGWNHNLSVFFRTDSQADCEFFLRCNAAAGRKAERTLKIFERVVRQINEAAPCRDLSSLISLDSLPAVNLVVPPKPCSTDSLITS
jgi:hypothetical protein